MKEKFYGIVITIVLLAGIAAGVWLYINGNKANELLSSYPTGNAQMDSRIEAGINENMIKAARFRGSNKEIVSKIDQSGRTPLHYAAGQGNAKIAELLLAQKAPVDAQDSHGMTPLHLAAMSGNAPIVKMLLKHHADMSITDGSGSTAAKYAEENGNGEIASLLRERGGED